jgi:hypothetical protein
MDEISKIGDINSINDLFDFKLSIKTIVFLGFAWGAVCLVVIVFLFGGINNTVAYGINIIESVKTTVLETRNKTIIKPLERPLERPADTNTDKTVDKKND